jgi:HSP20 family protein
VREGGDVVATLELPGAIIRESRSGSFRREFALPEHVTAEGIEADYDRGPLRIRVREVAKPEAEPKRITVRR